LETTLKLKEMLFMFLFGLPNYSHRFESVAVSNQHQGRLMVEYFLL
jgi:hypothetical protein